MRYFPTTLPVEDLPKWLWTQFVAVANALDTTNHMPVPQIEDDPAAALTVRIAGKRFVGETIVIETSLYNSVTAAGKSWPAAITTAGVYTYYDNTWNLIG